MTTRSDLPRVFAALQVLGTEAETPTDDGRSKIALAWDTTSGWEHGPRKAPLMWEPGDDRCPDCGGAAKVPADPEEPDGPQLACGACDATGWVTGDLRRDPQAIVDDERAAEQKQRIRAAEHHRELTETVAILDKAAQQMFRLMDLAVPPNPAEMKNRRTGDYEPWTPAEVELAGYCSSCWRHEQTFTPIYVDRKGMRRWKGSCSWCGPIRSQHKIDPPMVLLVKHLDGKNISEEEFNEAMTKAKQASQPKKTKKGKRKKAKAA